MLLNKIKIKKLNWGIAGCGKFAENTVTPNLINVKTGKISSVFSQDLERAKYIANKFAIKNSYDSYEDFLNSDINAVYIASKNSDHYSYIIKAAEAGKHILCEKPLVLTSEEANKVKEICEANGVILTVNYPYRFHPIVQKAQEIIANNMLGKIISISADFKINYPPNENYRFVKEHGGGPIIDLGTHVIDLIRYLAGDIKDIISFKDSLVYQSEVEDLGIALLKLNSGAYGTLSVSYCAKKAPNRIEIVGYNGYLTIDNLIGGRLGYAMLSIDINGQMKKVFRKRANKQLQLLRSVQKNFIHETTPLITLDDAVENVRLIEGFLNNANQR